MSASPNLTAHDDIVVTIPKHLAARLHDGVLNGTLLGAAEDLAHATFDPAHDGEQRLPNVRAKLQRARVAVEVTELLERALTDYEEADDVVVRLDKDQLLLITERIDNEATWTAEEAEGNSTADDVVKARADLREWRDLMRHLKDVTVATLTAEDRES